MGRSRGREGANVVRGKSGRYERESKRRGWSLGGGWDVICVLVFGPDREGRATLEVVCFNKESSNGQQASEFPKRDEE